MVDDKFQNRNWFICALARKNVVSQNVNKQGTKFFLLLTVSREKPILIRIEHAVAFGSPGNSEWEQKYTKKRKT